MAVAWVSAPILGTGTDDDPYRALDRDSVDGDRLEFVIPTDQDGHPTVERALCAVDVYDLTDLPGARKIKDVQGYGRRLDPNFDQAAHLGEGVPPEPGSFVNDTFTDTDGTTLVGHTGETGATWTAHPSSAAGNWKVQTNRVFPDASNVIRYASGVGPFATAEYDVTAVLRTVTSAANAGQGFCGRMDTAADTFYMARYNVASGVYELFKRVASTFTSLGTFTAAAPGANSSATLVLGIRDATKKLFVSGVERISSADNAITAAGAVGVRSGAAAATTTGQHFDSISATEAALSVSVPAPAAATAAGVTPAGQAAATPTAATATAAGVAPGGQVTATAGPAAAVASTTAPGAVVVAAPAVASATAAGVAPAGRVVAAPPAAAAIAVFLAPGTHTRAHEAVATRVLVRPRATATTVVPRTSTATVTARARTVSVTPRVSAVSVTARGRGAIVTWAATGTAVEPHAQTRAKVPTAG